MPREIGLIYTAESILAILAGRQTMTRRIPNNRLPNVGDLVWAKEAWRVGAWNENGGQIAVDYRADNHSRRKWIDIEDEDVFERLWIQCSDDAETAGVEFDGDGQYHWEPGESPCRWRPPTFMFKNAARIWLRVTAKRLEPLQAITEKDAIAEGIFPWKDLRFPDLSFHRWSEESPAIPGGPVAAFHALWNSLHKKPGTRWEDNPEVAVIEFDIISTEGGPG